MVEFFHAKTDMRQKDLPISNDLTVAYTNATELIKIKDYYREDGLLDGRDEKSLL